MDCPIYTFITAKTQELILSKGLTYGADDCKPFGVKELQARVRNAHARREHRERHHKLSLGDFSVYLSAQELLCLNPVVRFD